MNKNNNQNEEELDLELEDMLNQSTDINKKLDENSESFEKSIGEIQKDMGVEEKFINQELEDIKEKEAEEEAETERALMEEAENITKEDTNS